MGLQTELWALHTLGESGDVPDDRCPSAGGSRPWLQSRPPSVTSEASIQPPSPGFLRHLNSASVNPHSVFSCLLFSSYYLWSWLSQLVVNGSKWGQPWFPSLPLPFNQWGRRALLGRPRVYCVRTIHVRQALCTPGGSLSIKS